MNRILTFQSFSINEAMKFEPAELKKQIAGDERLAFLLTKDASKESIKDPVEFFRTFKNVVLNNQQIISYKKKVESFAYWRYEFETLRKLRDTEFDPEKHFSDVKYLVDLMLKDISKMGKQMLSTDAKKSVEEWINTSGNHNRRLYKNVMTELDSIPGLKPESPIKLYRGLMWSEYDMKPGREGRRFVQSMQNDGVVDYEAKDPESWTFSKSVAFKFASTNPASSEYSAMMNWLSNQGRYIDGELGAIVMVLAKPEDVLADLSRIGNNLRLKYEWESEVILKPGQYNVKIVQLFNEKGEIKPEEYLKSLSAGGDKKEIISEARNKLVPKIKSIFEKLNNAGVRSGWHRINSGTTPEQIRAIQDNEKEIRLIFGQFIDWLNKMNFKNEKPEINAMSSDDDVWATEIFKGLSTLEAYRRGAKRPSTMIYQVDNVDAAVEKMLVNLDVRDDIENYMRRNKIIARDARYYNRETLKPKYDRAVSEILGKDTTYAEAEPELKDISVTMKMLSILYGLTVER